MENLQSREEEIIDLVHVVEELPSPKRSKAEILKEKAALVDEWKNLQGRTDPEAKQRIEEIEAQAEETDQELELLNETKPGKQKKQSRKRFTIVTGIILAAVVIFWGFWSVWISERLKQTEKDLRNAQAELKKAQMSVVLSAQAEPKTEAAGKEAVSAVSRTAIVQKGEGIEHALIRQLQEDPFTYGFEGNATPKTVKKWAQKKAHQIAILAGYVNQKTGEEVRVRGKGENIAYILTVDKAKISVEQYSVDQTGSFNPDPDQVNQLASSYDDAQFHGVPDELQAYEYIHKG